MTNFGKTTLSYVQQATAITVPITTMEWRIIFIRQIMDNFKNTVRLMLCMCCGFDRPIRPCKITPWNSMEFHGVSWNSMEFHGSPMEFHGSSMELHGVPWYHHGIPWSSMEAPWNSMEFHGSSMEFHGVPWKPQGLSWNSMEAPWKPMESIEVSWNIGGVPWKLTEFHCVTHNSLKIKE